MKRHIQAILGAFVAVAAFAPLGASAQHQGFFERGPLASVEGEHGVYNIAWLTLQDQLFLQKPVYEVLVSYHPAARGRGAVRQRHWDEMLMVAKDEIVRRCVEPAQWEVLSSWQDYDTDDRALGAELRVNYSCR